MKYSRAVAAVGAGACIGLVAYSSGLFSTTSKAEKTTASRVLSRELPGGYNPCQSQSYACAADPACNKCQLAFK